MEDKKNQKGFTPHHFVSNCTQYDDFRKIKSGAGFTLIEMLLSVAVIGLLVGMSVPVYRNMFVKNDLDVAATTVAETLRRAQVQSQSSDGDISWGVKVQTGKISLFKGTSYITQDPNYEEKFDMPASIAISGTSEIVFTKFTGETTGGTITLSSDTDSKDITVNSKGMVGY